MEYPTVSIIVITYNEEEHIRPCLDSLFLLDYPEEKYEVIVVDSGTDRTREIVKTYPKVKLIQSEEKNFPLSRNVGVKESQNELIAFTDADCIVPPNWLKVLINSLDHEKIGGVGGNAFPPLESSRLGRWIACLGLPAGGAIGLDANIKDVEEGVSSLSTCNALYRKKVLEEVGGFDESLKFGDEDSEIAERIRTASYTLKYEPNSFVYHRVRDSFRDFITWNFRRGLARGEWKKVSFWKLLFEPFSLVWFFAGVLSVCILGLRLVLLGSWIILLSAMFLGTKKFKLLLQRRKKAKISVFALIVFLPLLFYLRRLTMNIAQWKVKLYSPK